MQPRDRSAASALTVASREAPHQLASCSWDRGSSTSIPSVVSSPKRSPSSWSRHATRPSVSRASNSSRLRSASPQSGGEDPEELPRGGRVGQRARERRSRGDRRLHVAEGERGRGSRSAGERRKVTDDVARPADPEHDLSSTGGDARDGHTAVSMTNTRSATSPSVNSAGPRRKCTRRPSRRSASTSSSPVSVGTVDTATVWRLPGPSPVSGGSRFGAARRGAYSGRRWYGDPVS